MQVAVAIGLAFMGLVGPGNHPEWLGLIAVGVAFMSASLDIVLRRLSDRPAPSSRAWVRCSIVGQWVSISFTRGKRRRIGFSRPHRLERDLSPSCSADGDGSHHDPSSARPTVSGPAPRTLAEAVGLPL